MILICSRNYFKCRWSRCNSLFDNFEYISTWQGSFWNWHVL